MYAFRGETKPNPSNLNYWWIAVWSKKGDWRFILLSQLTRKFSLVYKKALCRLVGRKRYQWSHTLLNLAWYKTSLHIIWQYVARGTILTSVIRGRGVVIHYLLVGYMSGSTGGYYKPAQKPWLEEGELTVFLLLNIHTAFYMLMFLPVGLCFSRHWSAKASF